MSEPWVVTTTTQEQSVILTETPPSVVVVEQPVTQVLVAEKQGPPGPPGEPGPPGPQGEPGAGGNWFDHTHVQVIPADSWIVEHNLGRKCQVTVIDSANNVVIGDVEYLDENRVLITFSSAFSGSAYCS